MFDDAGAVAGMLNVASDLTEKVLTRQRQTFQLDLGAELDKLGDAEEIILAAATALGKHLGANRVGYGEVQDDQVTFVPSACYAHQGEPLSGSYRLDAFGPNSIERQRQGISEISEDVLADPYQDPAIWSSIGTRAFISVPLIRDGQFRASLYVNCREPRRWSSGDVALIEDVASRTWTAVERARAEKHLRAERDRSVEILESIADAFLRR